MRFRGPRPLPAVVAMVGVFAAVGAAALAAAGRPRPASVSAARLAGIDAAVEASIAAGELPGAVVLVGRGGRTVYRRRSATGPFCPRASPRPSTPSSTSPRSPRSSRRRPP